MADFYEILKNAIGDTGATSAAERQLLYQRARAALDSQLSNFDPPLPVEARQAQYDRLGDAIGQLEEEVELAAKGGAASVEAVAMPPGKPPTPAKEPVPQPQSQPKVAAKAAPAVVPAAAHPGADGTAKRTPPAAAKPARQKTKATEGKKLPGMPQNGKQFGLGALAAAGLVVVALGGISWLAVQSGMVDGLLVGTSDAPPATLEPKKVAVEPIAAPTAPAIQPPPPPPPPAAQVQPIIPSEPVVAPTTTPAAEPPVQVAPADAQQNAAQADADKDQERVPQVGAAGSGEKAAFVVEELNAGGAPTETRLDASATWEVIGSGDDATLIFRVTVPARAATFEMTMRKNNESSLPASHVIEFVFSASGDNPDGQILSIPGMLIREKENEAGTPLRGAGAQIVPGQYLIGLSSAEPDVTHNLSALGSGNWIAVPALMENNKRALFLVAKGTSGNDAVNKVLAEWGQAR